MSANTPIRTHEIHCTVGASTKSKMTNTTTERCHFNTSVGQVQTKTTTGCWQCIHACSKRSTYPQSSV